VCKVAAPPPETRVESSLFAVVGLAWAAALIHVQAALGHAEESGLFAVLFWVLAAAQLAWGVVIYRWPNGTLLWAGAIVSVGVVAFWALSRTAGLPFGPEPWTPEEIGGFDVLATADEVALAAVVVMRSLRSARLPVAVLRYVTGAAAVILILLSSLSLAGLSGHVH
jgi:hypothetical protein